MKWKGPPGGIFTGLAHSTSNHNLVMRRDMPFPEPKLIGCMMECEMIRVPTQVVGTQTL